MDSLGFIPGHPEIVNETNVVMLIHCTMVNGRVFLVNQNMYVTQSQKV
jgi:hypothetical protein